MNAGNSVAGREFGARHCDLVFDQPHYLNQGVRPHPGRAAHRTRAGQGGPGFHLGRGGVPVDQREADEYFHYFAVEHRDDGAIDTMLNLYLSPANRRAMTRERRNTCVALWRGLWRAAGGR